MSAQKPQMSNNKKIAGTVLILVVTALAIIAVFSFLPPINLSLINNHPNSNPSNLSPSPEANIEIRHDFRKTDVINWTSYIHYSYTEEPDFGNVFLEVSITINNNGYVRFNTNPNFFYVTADNVTYSYDIGTSLLGEWETIDVLDGGKYTGTVVFQVPSTATSFKLSYQALTNYNINYEEA